MIAVALASSSAAHAQLSDQFRPSAAYQLSYDDNVVGLPSDDAALAATGSRERGDTVRAAEFGLVLDKSIGRQRLQAELGIRAVTYDRLTLLDHHDQVLKGAWDWQIGNHLSGVVASSKLRRLTDFDDYHLLVRRMQTERRKQFALAWQLHPRWRLRGEFGDYSVSYEGDPLFSGERLERALQAGADYLTPAGSSLGVTARHVDGEDRSNAATGQAHFSQDEIDLRAEWRPAGHIRLQLTAGAISRRYVSFGANDFSGGNGRINTEWALSGKTRLHISAWRELGVVDNIVAYSINRGYSIEPQWDIHSHLQANMLWRVETRDYRPARDIIQSLSGDQRRGRFASLKYSVGKRWRISGALGRSDKIDRGLSTGFSRNTAKIAAQYMF